MRKRPNVLSRFIQINNATTTKTSFFFLQSLPRPCDPGKAGHDHHCPTEHTQVTQLLESARRSKLVCLIFFRRMEQLKFHLLDCVAGQPCSQVMSVEWVGVYPYFFYVLTICHLKYILSPLCFETSLSPGNPWRP